MKNFLIFLLFLAPTIGYRFELGSFSVSVAEPIILFVSAMLLVQLLMKKGSISITSEPLTRFFIIISLWSFAVSTVASNLFMSELVFNLSTGLSDLRNWIIPLIGFITLLASVEQGWRKWNLLLFVQVVCYACFGIYQHITDSFRPFITEGANAKQVIFASGDTEFADFSVGFFVHPNDFAIYLFLGLMIGIGWSIGTRQHRGRKSLLLIPICLALYWTYAKTSILVMIIAASFFVLHILIKSNTMFKFILFFSNLVIWPLGWALLQFAPDILLTNLWWRVGLWDRVIYVAFKYELISLFGNGLELFAANSYYPQPHSLYLSMFLFYGLFGVGWVVFLLIYIGNYGFQIRQQGQLNTEPILAGLWIALLSYFVIGLVESTLSTIEMRTIFLWIIACFIGLSREIRNHRVPFISNVLTVKLQTKQLIPAMPQLVVNSKF